MKIKTVCEITGLTDRTIRYYIEEKLISPDYTESYLGRRSFSFSQADINTLEHISVLRKFDFTIDEIRHIIEDAGTSADIIANVRRRTEEAVSIGQEKLLALSGLNDGQAYTLDQLAEELSKPVIALPKHNEHIKWDPVKDIGSLLNTFLIFAVVWAPLVIGLICLIVRLMYFHYPVFSYRNIILALISFWPSVGVLVVSKSDWKWKIKAKKILLVLCILGIPINAILSLSIVVRSETTDILNYRCLDVDCIANRFSFYTELFPTWPHYFVNERQPDGSIETVYLDAHYYYSFKPGLDYTYDIYAQWPLEKEEFDNEVERVKALYEREVEDYEILQKGNYICLISYNGNPPFEEVTNSYTYCIFAYDETNLIVRYILCDSLENGLFQPYYLTLAWE